MITADKIPRAKHVFRASLPHRYCERKRFRPGRTDLNFSLLVLVALALGALSPGPRSACAAGPLSGVFTHHYDNQRTGAIVSETMLTTSNINPAAFGKLFTDPVDAQAYAEPLYVANVTIANKGTTMSSTLRPKMTASTHSTPTPADRRCGRRAFFLRALRRFLRPTRDALR